MIELIPLLKADRQREIISYIEKGYIFRNGKNNFKYVRNVVLTNVSTETEFDEEREVKEYIFQLRMTQAETRFFITNIDNVSNKNESCIYLTIYEIYELLLDLSNKIAKDKLNAILLSNRTKIWYMYYTCLEFRLDYFSEEIEEGNLNIPESNVNISYESLFLLIALIQEKSNYYWSISKDEKAKELIDGIIRLLVCLVSSKNSNILKENGWIYNEEKNKYIMDESFKGKLSKYYLTNEEFKNIMEVKS